MVKFHSGLSNKKWSLPPESFSQRVYPWNIFFWYFHPRTLGKMFQCDGRAYFSGGWGTNHQAENVWPQPQLFGHLRVGGDLVRESGPLKWPKDSAKGFRIHFMFYFFRWWKLISTEQKQTYVFFLWWIEFIGNSRGAVDARSLQPDIVQ